MSRALLGVALPLTTSWLGTRKAAPARYGSSSIQGRRPNQEDRLHACDRLPGHPDCALYAVYDGHGGARAAIFCAERMQGYLTRSSHFKARDLAKALHEAFRDCEADFIMVAGREGLRDGTTAVVALVEAKTLTVAHVGDSRGVLCRAGGETISITQDHKPELEAERRRIEALGGFVSHIGCWRAMGILAMSRAIGDLFLKPYVSAEPDISTVQLEDTDEFVVLASDGVFDVFDNEQVVQIVQGGLFSTPSEVAARMPA
ncbi:protein phosphatase 1f [Chrysochromulina tobinii]|uniref:Protein phosphatase 1f n=1 Tax=Chrysochromulina tobinii TaxID=1460289 RepID=A0A0M0K9G2_9EUKA|nr:protein phosphatase 1f [Chrysochromulina tobinii]|eukprot:KOO35445.1 protein phosphatase 1f [Chrysochromulina sp. CCMP291]